MLSNNNTGSSDLVNVTNTYIDKSNCDINANDDEDTKINDLLDEWQCLSAKNIAVLYNERRDHRSVSNGISSKMTIPQVNESLIVRRPSTISLKPIVPVSLENDVTDSCFGGKAESEHECSNGINIKFQDIIYRARRGFSWDRCKY